jgi:hypothetical protein
VVIAISDGFVNNWYLIFGGIAATLVEARVESIARFVVCNELQCFTSENARTGTDRGCRRLSIAEGMACKRSKAAPDGSRKEPL